MSDAGQDVIRDFIHVSKRKPVAMEALGSHGIASIYPAHVSYASSSGASSEPGLCDKHLFHYKTAYIMRHII